MGNTFNFVGGDRATADENGWLVTLLIEDWDARFLGDLYLQLSELDTGTAARGRDSFGGDSGRALDDLGTIDCTIARGGTEENALPFICTNIRSNITAAETRHTLQVRLPIGGTTSAPRFSEPIRVPLRGEVAGESSGEGAGYEVDFTFKNKNDIPAGSGHAQPAVSANSAVAPLRRRGDSPRKWIRLDFLHCPSCWVLERKLGLYQRPSGTRSDKIVGGNLWVGGKFFVDWFNQDFQPTHAHDPAGVSGAGFRGRLQYRRTFMHWFEHCANLWSAELSPAQFACMFSVTYNESPTFLPKSEMGHLAYFFEYRDMGEGRRKNSYNRMGWHSAPTGQQRTRSANGNYAAGHQLRQWWNETAGKGAEMRAEGLTEDILQFDVWDGVWWKDRVAPPPYVDSPPVSACPTRGDNPPNGDLQNHPVLAHWVKQCDFNKLRGRGLMQTTGRANYLGKAAPALEAAGHPHFDLLSDEELHAIFMRDARVSQVDYRSWLQRIDQNQASAITRLATEVSGELFGRVGLGYSGTHNGRDKVRWRSTQLHQAMLAATWECRPLSASGLAEIRAGGSDQAGIRAVQQILADLGYGGTPSGTFDAATSQRLRQFQTYFFVQGAADDRLTIESTLQLLKWHEARNGRDVRTSPDPTAVHPGPHQNLSPGATPNPTPAEAVDEPAPDAVDEPAEPEEAAHAEEAEEPAAEAEEPAQTDEPTGDGAGDGSVGPAREPEPSVTEATHDEPDTIAVEPFLVSRALGACADLERVARDAAFRRGEGDPLRPGDARATPAALRALQTALRALGYDLGTRGPEHDGIDGEWSARGRTVRAVQQHQRERGPAWAAQHDVNVGNRVRTDGGVDWATLYTIDRDARDAENRPAPEADAPVSVVPSTSSEPASTDTGSGGAADKPARSMTRLEALEHIIELNRDEGVGIQILDRAHGGPSGYGTYPNCRVSLPSPCYGVILRARNWSRTQVDPRLAVGVARLCRWLHDRGVIGILNDTIGGFLGGSERAAGPHGLGYALDLSSFDFDADRAEADYGGHTQLMVNNVARWPRYDATRFRFDADPGLIEVGWRYSSGRSPEVWRPGNRHSMWWAHRSGTHTSAKIFHTHDAQAPFERLHRRDAESPDMLVRADGVPAELELFRNPSLLDLCERPTHVDRALPFGGFIADLYAFVQREFKVNDTIDATDGRPDPVPLEEFKGLVNPCHPRLGHAWARDGATSTTRADGAGPRARFGHPDHLHLEVPALDPDLPNGSS